MTCYFYDSNLVGGKAVRIRRQGGKETMKISFKRTVRVPDNDAISELPPDMGNFPLYKVSSYAQSLPAEMVKTGGIFMPMYQREAMWIKFKANSPFAVKVYIGHVNAISGEPAAETSATTRRRKDLVVHRESIQDYLVVPDQKWLDGIATEGGVVNQFVATNLGEGYTVEAQITGQETFGGIQFEITPAVVDKEERVPIYVKTLTGKSIPINISKNTFVFDVKKMLEKREGIPVREQRLIFAGAELYNGKRMFDYAEMRRDITVCLALRLYGGGVTPSKDPVGMGIAAGGMINQTVVRDEWPAAKWHKTATIVFKAHILDADAFQRVTGLPAPETPISMATYARWGLPFFKFYEEPSDVRGNFTGVKSIGELTNVKEPSVAVPTKAIMCAPGHSAMQCEMNDKNESGGQSQFYGFDHEGIASPCGPMRKFRTISELEKEIHRLLLGHTK